MNMIRAIGTFVACISIGVVASAGNPVLQGGSQKSCDCEAAFRPEACEPIGRLSGAIVRIPHNDDCKPISTETSKAPTVCCRSLPSVDVPVMARSNSKLDPKILPASMLFNQSCVPLARSQPVDCASEPLCTAESCIKAPSCTSDRCSDSSDAVASCTSSGCTMPPSGCAAEACDIGCAASGVSCSEGCGLLRSLKCLFAGKLYRGCGAGLKCATLGDSSQYGIPGCASEPCGEKCSDAGCPIPKLGGTSCVSKCSRDPKEIAALIHRSLTHCKSRCRREAIQRLADCYSCACDPEVMAALIYGLNDTDERVRRAAASGIGKQLRKHPSCCTAEVASALACAKRDRDLLVKLKASLALKSCGVKVCTSSKCKPGCLTSRLACSTGCADDPTNCSATAGCSTSFGSSRAGATPAPENNSPVSQMQPSQRAQPILKSPAVPSPVRVEPAPGRMQPTPAVEPVPSTEEPYVPHYKYFLSPEAQKGLDQESLPEPAKPVDPASYETTSAARGGLAEIFARR